MTVFTMPLEEFNRVIALVESGVIAVPEARYLLGLHEDEEDQEQGQEVVCLDPGAGCQEMSAAEVRAWEEQAR